MAEEPCHAPDGPSTFPTSATLWMEPAATEVRWPRATPGQGSVQHRSRSSNSWQWPPSIMPDATETSATNPSAARLPKAKSHRDRFVKSTWEEWKVGANSLVQAKPPLEDPKKAQRRHLWQYHRRRKWSVPTRILQFPAVCFQFPSVYFQLSAVYYSTV